MLAVTPTIAFLLFLKYAIRIASVCLHVRGIFSLNCGVDMDRHLFLLDWSVYQSDIFKASKY